MRDERARIVLAAAFLLAVVSTPPQRHLAFLVYAGLLSWAAALAGVSFPRLLLRGLPVLGFSLLAAAGLPFLPGGERIAVGGLGLSERGLWLLLGAAEKSLLGVVAVLLLKDLAGLGGVMAGLRGLGVPALFVDLLGLTDRYITVLAEEAASLRRAAACRGYRPRWLPQAAVVGMLAGNLFLRAWARAERVHGAMRLRGFQGRMPACAPPAIAAADLAALAVLVPLLLAVRMLA